MVYHDDIRMILTQGFLTGITLLTWLRSPSLALKSHCISRRKKFLTRSRSSGKDIGMRYLSCRHGILQMPDNLLVPDNIVETNHSESPLLFLYTNLCSPCLHYSILCYPFKTIFVYEREFIYFIIFSTHNSKFSLANLNLIPAFRMFSSEKSS